MLTDEELAAIEARDRNDGILGPLAEHLVDAEETIDSLLAEVKRLRAQHQGDDAIVSEVQPTEDRPTREPDAVMTGYLPEIDGVLQEWSDEDYTPDEAITRSVERDVWYGPWRLVLAPTEEPQE